MSDIYLLLLLLDNNPKFKTFEGNAYDDLHVGGVFSDVRSAPVCYIFILSMQ